MLVAKINDYNKSIESYTPIEFFMQVNQYIELKQ